jgi:uncharacterized coiled-coil DUF342 family protein
VRGIERKEIQKKLWRQLIIRGGKSWYVNRVNHLNKQIKRYRSLIKQQRDKKSEYNAIIKGYLNEIYWINQIINDK